MSETLPTAAVRRHVIPDDVELGPAMQRLTERQRKFVYELLSNGGDQGKAYLAAGYNSTTKNAQWSNASKLANSDSIQAAILEEGHKFAGARIGVWMQQVEAIAMNPAESGAARLKALDMLLSRGGSIQKSEVVHTRSREMSEEQLLQKVKANAEKLGLDPRTLLAKYGYVDAEFVDITPAPSDEKDDPVPDNGIDDWLTWKPDDASATEL